MKRSPLAAIFLGPKMNHLRIFLVILIPNFISALLEGASFAFILLAFSQFSEGGEAFSSLKIPLIHDWIVKFPFSSSLQAFVVWILVAIFLQGVRSALVFLTTYMTSHLSLKIQTSAQRQVYAQILRLSFSCVNRYRLGDLAEHVKTPSIAIPPFMDHLNRLINVCMMALVALYLMIKISTSLTLVTLLFFVFFGYLQKKIIQKIVEHSTHLSAHMADFGEWISQTLGGIRLIHTYHRHRKIQEDISTILDTVSSTSKKLHFWNSSIPSVNEMIGIISLGSILVASLLIFEAHHTRGVSHLFTFLILAYRVSTRIQIGIGALGTMAVHVGPIIRLKELLKSEDKEYLPLSGHSFKRLKKEIAFRSVTLRYGKELSLAISDLSCTIPCGSTTAIVGPSGGGKSSILDMLIRLYEPTSGEIAIDGVPLSELEIASWRHALGVVSQDPFIFNHTVAENIRFGMEGVSEEQMIEVAKLSGAHDFIMSLKEQYQTKLGEKGYKLSGGERQRLALARALLKNPQVLILDEATSNLDSLTEQAVQRALTRYAKDRTALIIAHRLSTITFADQILYIENGRLIETGTHEQLIANGGKYALLWSLQSQTNANAHVYG